MQLTTLDTESTPRTVKKGSGGRLKIGETPGKAGQSGTDSNSG